MLRDVVHAVNRRPVPVWRQAAVMGLVLVLVAVAGGCSTDPGPQPADTTDEAPSSTTVSPPAAPRPQSEPRSGGTLTYGLTSLRRDWNPASGVFDADAFQVGRALFDTLLVYDDSNNLTPFLATEVKPSEDLRTWTLTLRDGVRFHDGRDLTAEAVRAGLDAMRRSPDFSAAMHPITDVTVDGSNRVVVTTRTAWSAFPHLLAGQVGLVAEATAEGEVGTGPFGPAGVLGPPPSESTGGSIPSTSSPSGSTAPTSSPSEPAGAPVAPTTTGLQGASGEASELVLVRNPFYWQVDLPHLDAVRFKAVPDEAARAMMVRQGSLDVGLFRVPSRMAVLADEDRKGTVQYLVDPSAETPELALALQTDRPPFEDPAARQALAQAVDRDALADDLFAGQFPPAEGPYSEGARWYGRAPWAVHDVVRARQTVEDYTKAHGESLSLHLLAPATDRGRDLVDALRRQMAEAGIRVEPEWAGPDQMNRRLVAGQYEAALVSGFGGWHPDQDEPVLRGYVEGSVPPAGAPKDAPPAVPLPLPDPASPPWGVNITRFRSEIIDRALDAARKSTDITKQAEQYTSVQEALAREAPYIFLVHVQTAVVARLGVRDLVRWTTPTGSAGISQFRGTVSLAQVWLAR